MEVQIAYHRYEELYPTKLMAMYHALRDAVVGGRLVYASRLPSTRELAQLHGLSRGTVSQAYEMLAAEGYLSSERGSGTFVAFRQPGASGSGNRSVSGSESVLSGGGSVERGASYGEDGGQASNNGRSGEPSSYYHGSGGPASNNGGSGEQAMGGGPASYYDGSRGPASYDPRNGESASILGTGTRGIRLSEWGQRVAELPGYRASAMVSGGVDFGRFLPDVAGFPREAWSRCLYAQVREQSATAGRGERAEPLGSLELREAIAHYVRRARGITALPEHVAVTGGSMQALAMAAQLLLGPGETAVAETPAYRGIRQAIRTAGATCIDAAVDTQGIVPADWDARVLFVTPARQFPTGSVLSLARRQALLRWADEHEAVIVEDDYDSEFRHRGKSLEPLKVLDRGERVVYVGSFTKTLLPGTRIGYAVLPPALARPFARAVQLVSGPYPVNLLEQRALAAFMASGEYERHLRRMKRSYSRKFHLLAQLLHDQLRDWFDWVESDTGLHLFGWWRGTPDGYTAYRERCCSMGVCWAEAEMEMEMEMVKETRSEEGVRMMAEGKDVAPHGHATTPPRQGIYLNFPHLSEAELVHGVELMRKAGVQMSLQATTSSPA